MGIEHTIGVNDQWEYMDKTKLEFVSKLLPHQGRTLEVGCGSARLSAWLSQKGFCCYCLDNSRQALRVAKANFGLLRTDGEFILADALRLPFKDNLFDVVMSTGLIEHFAHPVPLLQEMNRVLRVGGRFYSDIVPNKFSLTRLVRTLLLPLIYFYQKVTNIRPEHPFSKKMTKNEIKQFLQDAGFANGQVISAWIVPLLPLPSASKGFFRLLNNVWGVILYKSQFLWKPLARTRLGDILCFLYYATAIKERQN